MQQQGFDRILLVAGSIAMLTSCNNEPSSPPGELARDPGEAAKNSGEWVMLFNGRNLDGWRSYGEDAARPEWIVEEGSLVLDVDENTADMTGGDLVTEQQYENFELELEWKISAGGNSGLLFGVREIEGQEVAYETGIEMQILDDDRHNDGRAPETSAGAGYALYAPVDKRLRPVGEYNEVRLIVNDGHVEYWLNGRKVVEFVIGSDDWQTRIANSKFADWDHFARYRKGHIALQDHTDRVWFRNIRIREL